MAEQNNEESELKLNAPKGSIIREAEEVVNRAIKSNHASLIDKITGWQGKISCSDGYAAVYGVNITYILAPKRPMYDLNSLNRFVRSFVSRGLKDNEKEDNYSLCESTFCVSREFRRIESVHFGSLHFEEDAGKISTETTTTTKTRVMLDPALEIVAEDEADPSDSIEEETTSRVDMVHNRVLFEFYPNEELAKRSMQLNAYGAREEPSRRTPFEEFRRNKLFNGNYKEGDIVKLDFKFLKESANQSGILLQSAEEAAAFRVLSDIGADYDPSKLTRTVALYFKERGKWHVAFDDSSNPDENPIYSMHERWEPDKYLHHSSSRIVAPKKDTLVKALMERAKSSDRVVCIEGLDLSLQNNPITRAALNHWAEPYEVYVSGLDKESDYPPIVEILPKKYLERRVGVGKVDLRIVSLDWIVPKDHSWESSSNGSICLGGGGGELNGFARLPDGIK